MHRLSSELSERLATQVSSADSELTRRLSEQMETEKAKRVSHSVGLAVRRLGKQQLTKGWQTWLDMYLEHQRHKRMLASAAGRLMKPALSAALTHWRVDWQVKPQQAAP